MAFHLFNRWPLKYVLIVPFCALVLALAVIIGASSFLTGRAAVDDLDNQLLADMANRVEQAVSGHLQDADLVLGTLAQGRDYSDDAALEARFFDLTALSPSVTYLYLGRPNNQFVGIEREDDGRIIAKLRNGRYPQRANFEIRRPGDRQRPLGLDPDYEPTRRPWYTAALTAGRITWSPLYVSYAKKNLMVTRALPLAAPGGGLQGVAAVDVPLGSLSGFLRKLSLSTNGVAFIMEPDGNLIATSTPEEPYVQGKDGRQERLAGRASVSPLIRDTVTYLLTGPWATRNALDNHARAISYDAGGEKIHLAVKHMSALSGLPWVIVVAAPQSDFIGNIISSTQRTAAISALALILTIVLGLLIFRSVTHDLERLTGAAQQFGAGESPGSLPVTREDEIGVLARAFAQMSSERADSMATIRRQNQQLATSNAALERRVSDRTHEVLEKNSHLEREIRDRKSAEAQVAQLFKIVEQTEEGIIVCDAAGRVTYINPGFTRLAGYSLSDMQTERMGLFDEQRFDAPLGEEDGLMTDLRRTLAAGRTYRGVRRARAKDGTGYHAELAVTPVANAEGVVSAFIVLERDVTQREAAREAVLKKLHIDSLTGLFNREAITKRLRDMNSESVERRRVRQRLALLFMDLDGFKAVNDTHGHDAGDEALIEAAQRISAQVRLTDAVARRGGDEFVVLLGDVTDRASAVAAAEKIEAAFAKSFVLGDARISLGVSIGIALYPEDADDFESLLGVADAAMYRIKRVRRLRAPRAQ